MSLGLGRRNEPLTERLGTRPTLPWSPSPNHPRTSSSSSSSGTSIIASNRTGSLDGIPSSRLLTVALAASVKVESQGMSDGMKRIDG